MLLYILFDFRTGPLIVSPDRLLTVLAREVVYRRAQEFKIEALRDLKKLFPVSTNPFYAGFGNRPSDIVSYNATGVPTGKIFIIDPKGVVSNASSKVLQQDYIGMAKLTDVMFPPVNYGRHSSTMDMLNNGVGFGTTGSHGGFGSSSSSGNRVSTQSCAQDAQFNDVAFWSNRAGIIESDEDGSQNYETDDDDLGALSDNSDFEYFGGGEEEEKQINQDIHDIEQLQNQNQNKKQQNELFENENIEIENGNGTSSSTLILDSPPRSLFLQEEKTPSSSRSTVQKSFLFDNGNQTAEILGGITNNNLEIEKMEEEEEEDADALNTSIAAIAEIVASESLVMSKEEIIKKEQELLEIAARSSRSSSLSSMNQKLSKISSTSVD